MNSKTEKIRPERKLKPPCGPKCRTKCSEKIIEEERQAIFESYWAMGDINMQRQFISNSIKPLIPEYRYVREGGKRKPRKNNNLFHFISGPNQVRVCKLFFKNTLDINDRTIRTVIDKQNKVAGTLVEKDKRGRHDNHTTVDPEITKRVKAHIDSIPRIESHYTRARSTRTYILYMRITFNQRNLS